LAKAFAGSVKAIEARSNAGSAQLR
jgi:hypothetical protein